jgi:hypothetical protein
VISSLFGACVLVLSLMVHLSTPGFQHQSYLLPPLFPSLVNYSSVMSRTAFHTQSWQRASDGRTRKIVRKIYEAITLSQRRPWLAVVSREAILVPIPATATVAQSPLFIADCSADTRARQRRDRTVAPLAGGQGPFRLLCFSTGRAHLSGRQGYLSHI